MKSFAKKTQSLQYELPNGTQANRLTFSPFRFIPSMEWIVGGTKGRAQAINVCVPRMCTHHMRHHIRLRIRFLPSIPQSPHHPPTYVVERATGGKFHSNDDVYAAGQVRPRRRDCGVLARAAAPPGAHRPPQPAQRDPRGSPLPSMTADGNEQQTRPTALGTGSSLSYTRGAATARAARGLRSGCTRPTGHSAAGMLDVGERGG
jgi:hypothetical protein